MRVVLDIGLTVGALGAQNVINHCYRLIRGLAMKLKKLLFACILLLPLGLIYAQGQSGSPPPGHNSDPDTGQGHVRHQGVGNGHTKFDTTPS